MQKAHLSSSPEVKKKFPDKLFYKIGEVSRIAEVEPYVLRYWESEFPFLRPRKSKSGQRIYVKKDLELILEIKHLLYNERFTIEGVRKRFTEGFRPAHSVPTGVISESGNALSPEFLKRIKQRLRGILSHLS